MLTAINIKMQIERYELKTGRNLTIFEFISQGSKGEIVKLIQFVPTNYKNLYNLAFGDSDPTTGKINDIVVSNNGDTELVLATVVSAVYLFTDRYPEAWVHATGSTMARTRLYRMGITKYLLEAIVDFDIYGQIDDDWEIFRKGVSYDAFVVKKKLRNFDL